MVDAKRLVELEEENHELRNSLNTARLKLQLEERRKKQYVVIEMVASQDPPVAAWGTFDGRPLADAFAEALQHFPGHTGLVVVLELNKEPLE